MAFGLWGRTAYTQQRLGVGGVGGGMGMHPLQPWGFPRLEFMSWFVLRCILIYFSDTLLTRYSVAVYSGYIQGRHAAIISQRAQSDIKIYATPPTPPPYASQLWRHHIPIRPPLPSRDCSWLTLVHLLWWTSLIKVKVKRMFGKIWLHQFVSLFLPPHPNPLLIEGTIYFVVVVSYWYCYPHVSISHPLLLFTRGPF